MPDSINGSSSSPTSTEAVRKRIHCDCRLTCDLLLKIRDVYVDCPGLVILDALPQTPKPKKIASNEFAQRICSSRRPQVTRPAGKTFFIMIFSLATERVAANERAAISRAAPLSFLPFFIRLVVSQHTTEHRVSHPELVYVYVRIRGKGNFCLFPTASFALQTPARRQKYGACFGGEEAAGLLTSRPPSPQCAANGKASSADRAILRSGNGGASVAWFSVVCSLAAAAGCRCCRLLPAHAGSGYLAGTQSGLGAQSLE